MRNKFIYFILITCISFNAYSYEKKDLDVLVKEVSRLENDGEYKKADYKLKGLKRRSKFYNDKGYLDYANRKLYKNKLGLYYSYGEREENKIEDVNFHYEHTFINKNSKDTLRIYYVKEDRVYSNFKRSDAISKISYLRKYNDLRLKLFGSSNVDRKKEFFQKDSYGIGIGSFFSKNTTWDLEYERKNYNINYINNYRIYFDHYFEMNFIGFILRSAEFDNDYSSSYNVHYSHGVTEGVNYRVDLDFGENNEEEFYLNDFNNVTHRINFMNLDRFNLEFKYQNYKSDFREENKYGLGVEWLY